MESIPEANPGAVWSVLYVEYSTVLNVIACALLHSAPAVCTLPAWFAAGQILPHAKQGNHHSVPHCRPSRLLSYAPGQLELTGT